VLPESRNIGFGQLRRIRHNTPLKALNGQRLIGTFPKQRESKACLHNNKSIENALRRCSLSRRPKPTSREDREHSDDSRVRAFEGFQNRVESSVDSQSVQCPEICTEYCSVPLLVEQLVSVILGYIHEFCVFSKSIKVIRNPQLLVTQPIHLTI
jgi:hypothetical protein